MNTTTHLFVYGSLRSGFRNQAYAYLSKYFTLAFAYNLKNFGTPKKQEVKDDFIPKVGYPGQ